MPRYSCCLLCPSDGWRRVEHLPDVSCRLLSLVALAQMCYGVPSGCAVNAYSRVGVWDETVFRYACRQKSARVPCFRPLLIGAGSCASIRVAVALFRGTCLYLNLILFACAICSTRHMSSAARQLRPINVQVRRPCAHRPCPTSNRFQN
jgi:hypothetical protein